MPTVTSKAPITDLPIRPVPINLARHRAMASRERRPRARSGSPAPRPKASMVRLTCPRFSPRAAMIEAARDRWGRLDILVNNAAVRGPVMAIDDMDVAGWDEAMAINVTGVALCIKHAVPLLRRQGGSIINISSIYGVVANDPTLYLGTDMKQPATYSFVKAGMINFTRYLANYYGKQGIRANCISPGGYFDNQPEAFVDEYTRRVPVGRMLDNEDIKGAVVYLASAEAAMVAQNPYVTVRPYNRRLSEEIAEDLFISVKTVETHASNVLRKTQQSNRNALTRWAHNRRID